jgi:FHA domain/FhaA, N-terminal domain
VSVARSLERRLEKLFEGVAGRVFSGKIHPSELAGRLAREADFARFQHATGPATGNLYVIIVNPADLTMDPGEIESILTDEMTDYTAEEGLRLEGPVTVRVTTTDETATGRVHCHVEVSPGPPVVWSRLVGETETLDIGRNRVLVGRSPEADVTIDHDDVSRRHALLFREHGQVWLQDLSSANGTWVDGRRLQAEPVRLDPGSIVTFSEHPYRLVGI